MEPADLLTHPFALMVRGDLELPGREPPQVSGGGSCHPS